MTAEPTPDIPPEIRTAVRADLEDRGLEADTIGPADSAIALADQQEQYYVATVRHPDGTTALFLYFAFRVDGEWQVSFSDRITG